MTTDSLLLDTLPATRKSSVLAIGPWSQGEFAILRDQVSECDTWSLLADCNSASELVSCDELLVDSILLAQPLPGFYKQAQIETLRRLAPLAQIVVVAGTWCEGELRTGKPLSGVLRLHWHEFAHWWCKRMNQVVECSPCLDGPLTLRDSPGEPTIAATLSIHTPTLASYEALTAVLGRSGAHCLWVLDSQVPDAATIGLWDGGQLDPQEWQQLENFATKLKQNGGALVTLLDFPRKEHILRLRKLGCNTVFGKPYVVTELITAIARLWETREHCS